PAGSARSSWPSPASPRPVPARARATTTRDGSASPPAAVPTASAADEELLAPRGSRPRARRGAAHERRAQEKARRAGLARARAGARQGRGQDGAVVCRSKRKKLMNDVDAYPLTWPIGWKRTD